MSPTVRLTPNPPAISYAVFAKCLANGVTAADAERMAALRPDVPQVAHAFGLEKTGIPAGDMSGWSAALNDSGISTELQTVLRDGCAFDALKGRMRQVPFLLRVPREVTANSFGGIVAEGSAAPLGALTFDTVELAPQKVITTTVLSRELLRLGKTSDVIVRDILVAGLGKATDAVFFDPAATTSILYGVTPVISSGATAAAMMADAAAMIASVSTSLASGVWVMTRKTMATIAATMGAAASGLPNFFCGLPVIATASLPAQIGSPSGNLIALIDAREVLVADAGIELVVGDQATAQMDTQPTQEGTTPTGSTAVSFFQNRLVGFQQVRYVNWAARSGAATWMSTAY